MMPGRAGRRIVLGSALATPFIRSARAAPIAMRVSVDTSLRHGRTVSIADFLRKLEAASQGEIAPRLFAGGQLFADRDVIRALVHGHLDMAAPGT
jgi:TRAP-type C4-dicarboxylate transport system substrate-binding protein